MCPSTLFSQAADCEHWRMIFAICRIGQELNVVRNGNVFCTILYMLLREIEKKLQRNVLETVFDGFRTVWGVFDS